jgi:PAS domain S-box-containing protein
LDNFIDLGDPDTVEGIKGNILAIWEEASLFEREWVAETPSGKRLTLAINAYIPPPTGENPCMLVNIIDITERRRLEKTLEEERALLTAVIDNLPDFIYLKDLAHRFILVNRSTVELVGAPDAKAMIGKTDRDYFPVELADKFMRDERSVMETARRRINIEEPSVSAAGDLKWVLTTKSPLVDAAGRVTGIVGIGRDITERKQAEAALQAAKEYAENLIQTANVLVVGLDVNGKITAFNETAEHVTGYSRAEIKDRDWLEALAPGSRYPEARAGFERLVKDGLPRNFEHPLLTKSGEERYVVWQNSEVREGGRVVGSISFGMDITERKRAEEKSLQLATLVASSNDAIVGMDLNRIITTWNAGAEKVYGYSAEEVIGRSISVLMPPDLGAEARRLGERIGQGRHLEQFEAVRKRKDGALIDVSLTLSPLTDAKGTLVGYAGIGRDITEQKKIRAQLMRAQKMENLSTLLGGIAHQFNNINTVIYGNLELLGMENGLTERAGASIAAAQKGVRRAAEITDRLLVLTGSSEARREKLRLDELVQSSVLALKGQFEIEGISVRLDLRETVPIEAIPSEIGFILSSLFANALHSLIDRPSPVVTVRTGNDSGFALLEVSDTGCGIAPEDLARLFTPFFTTKGEFAAEGSTQARVKGVGLSLPLCQAIVLEFGGRIDVESQPGQGSTFRVRFPPAPLGAA